MTPQNYLPIEVIGVRVEMPSNQPIVLLREIGGVRYLPIWVGSVEASAIAFAQQGLLPPRPLTHDLLKNIIETLGTPLVKVHLTELKEGIFYSSLFFEGDLVVSARPSDAIALAIRTGAPILAVEELFAQAGIEIPEDSNDEVEKFKEFLDGINPDDFAS